MTVSKRVSASTSQPASRCEWVTTWTVRGLDVAIAWLAKLVTARAKLVFIMIDLNYN